MKRRQAMGSLICVFLLSIYFLPGSAAASEIKVLSFNIWDIFSAKSRVERAELIGPAVAGLNPDVVVLVESWSRSHREIIKKGLDSAGYQYQEFRYFKHPVKYGTGLTLISKFPIRKTDVEYFTSNGPASDTEHLSGKGIVHAVLDTPYGILDFYSTHMIARMTAIFDKQGNYLPGDDKENDRILQALQIRGFIDKTRTPGARCLIAAGDFNVSPEMLEYDYLVAVNRFQSSFEEVHPGENPSTYSREDNWVTDDFSRIDHIFYKNFAGPQGFHVKPVSSEVVMKDKKQGKRGGKMVNLSDHYGLLSVFQVMDKDGIALTREWSLETSGKVMIDPPSPSDPQSAADWHNLAQSFLMQALEKKNRGSAAIIPLAEIEIGLNKDGQTTKVHLTEEDRSALDKLVGKK